MKRDLDSLKRKAESEHGEVGCGSSAKRQLLQRSSSESRIYDMKCVFCKKIKYQKKSHTRETLVKASQLRADATLRKIAIVKGDEDIIALTSRDIVAAEAHYHRSCYRSYILL